MLTNLARQVTNQTTDTSVLIPSGSDTSNAFELPSQCTPIEIYVPSNFTGENIKFIQIDPYNQSYVRVNNPNTGDDMPILVGQTPGWTPILPADAIAIVGSFKIVASSEQTSDVQLVVRGRTFL